MKRIFLVCEMKFNFVIIFISLFVLFTSNVKSAEIQNINFNYFAFVRNNLEPAQLSYEKLDELVLKSSMNYLVALDALEVVCQKYNILCS